MAQIINYKGNKNEVSFNTIFTTDYGLKFFLIEHTDTRIEVFKEEQIYKDALALHYLNVGCAIFEVNPIQDENGILPCHPMCGENDLFEVYNLIENGKCVAINIF